MKILSYNINRSNQTKVDKVLAMDADIMVLPECAVQSQIQLPQGYEMTWMGLASICDWKGLGVIWKDNIKISVAPWFNEEHKYILPLLVNDDLLLIAAWPTIITGIKKTYPQILLETLKEYESHIRKYPTLICGDYNCFTNQSGVSKKTGTFEQCIDYMDSLGLHSLYHTLTGEMYGKETKATYFHQFKEDMPFFIDYVFTNMNVLSYELCSWDKELSDHCPQMIEL